MNAGVTPTGKSSPGAPASSNNGDASSRTFNFLPFSDDASDSLGPAESLALACLRAGRCDNDDLARLSSLLPGEVPARSSGLVQDERSFTTGAYCHGPMIGLRSNSKIFKYSTRLLTTCARLLFKDLHFSTVGLFHNIKTKRHRDRNNLKNSLNGVAPISNFRGGDVRLHQPDGAVDLQVSEGPVLFDASVEHETLDWFGPSRLVLVVFTVSKVTQLSSIDKSLLVDAGFPLPLDNSACEHRAHHHDGHTTSASTTSPEGLILDVFAGDATFAKTAQKAGFKVLAFDLKPKRAQFAVQPLDPTKADELQVLKEAISENHARISLLQLTVPLLAAFFSATNGSKDFAESLTRAIVEIVSYAIVLEVPVAILHPSSSSFWSDASVLCLLQHKPSFKACFHQCMHGGTQDRLATWWSTSSWISPLAVRCSGDHKHRSHNPLDPVWPILMWQRAVELLSNAVLGVAAPAPLYGPAPSTLRPALGKQSKKARPLVSEFASYDSWALPLESSSGVELLLGCYPKGAKVVRRKLVSWGSVRVCVCPQASLDKLQSVLTPRWSWALNSEDPIITGQSDDAHVSMVCGMFEPLNFVETAELVWVGIPREPEDFLTKAVLAGHPKSLLDSEVDPQVSLLIDNLLESQTRCPDKGPEALKLWSDRREQLQTVEAEARKTWPVHVAQVLGDKATVLLNELLNKFDFPDTRLVKHMTQGFRLSGWLCKTGVFVPDPRPPSSTMEAQLKTAKVRNQATIAKLATQASDEVTQQAWSETQEEVARGWLFEDCDPALDSVLIARRFGLKQGQKVRVIDDCKACSFNSTAGLPEKYRLHGVEFIAAFLLRCMQDPRSTGIKISGRTLDLTSAYKQYALHSTDRDVLRIGVADCDGGRPRFFGVNALPFGATGSVPGFLRVAAALWHLGSRALGLCWVNYFDDFPMFCRDEDEEVVDQTAASFLRLLSVLFAETGRKATRFAKIFKALGLMFDLSNFGEGEVTVGHTPERVAELADTIQRIVESGCLSQAEAESLRGRLHWFTSFLFGRRASQSMNSLSDWIKSGTSNTRLSEELKEALTYLKDVALTAAPVRISRSLSRTFIVFTDGSLENQTACLGGILHDHSGRALAFFSVRVDRSALDRLYEHSSHPIYEVELLAIWAAMSLWKGDVHDSYTVFYSDNEAARGALISARSSTLSGKSILDEILKIEDSSICRPWYGRVPTHSNCADDPSREVYTHLLSKGVRRDSLDAPFPC